MKVQKPSYNCFCCKSEFKSQKRFSRKNQNYRNYCSNCRKICYICLCRHGNQGDTCSKYCSNKYRKIREKWKKLNPKKNIAYLERALKSFRLDRIEDESLNCIFSYAYVEDIKINSLHIRDKMIILQDSIKLESKGNTLIFGVNKIPKYSFEIISPKFSSMSLYKLKTWREYLKLC